MSAINFSTKVADRHVLYTFKPHTNLKETTTFSVVFRFNAGLVLVRAATATAVVVD